jgi:hypothetical protein
VRAWVGGAWRDFDTTPPAWFAAEAAQAPAWSQLADLWSWSRYRLAAWSAQASARGCSDALLWLALPLFAWLAWRTLRGRRAETAAASTDTLAASGRPGEDSEFYLIEARIAEFGHGRHPAESVSEWLARVARDTALDAAALRPLVRLHYRHRFDPQGLPAPERAALRAQALSWLARNPARAGA